MDTSFLPPGASLRFAARASAHSILISRRSAGGARLRGGRVCEEASAAPAPWHSRAWAPRHWLAVVMVRRVRAAAPPHLVSCWRRGGVTPPHVRSIWRAPPYGPSVAVRAVHGHPPWRGLNSTDLLHFQVGHVRRQKIITLYNSLPCRTVCRTVCRWPFLSVGCFRLRVESKLATAVYSAVTRRFRALQNYLTSINHMLSSYPFALAFRASSSRRSVRPWTHLSCRPARPREFRRARIRPFHPHITPVSRWCAFEGRACL
jgi:hypothetical protein